MTAGPLSGAHATVPLGQGGAGAPRERLEGIQYARAVAALAVLLSHAVGDIAAHGGASLAPFTFVGAAGVDLFFVISGFVMVHSSIRMFGRPGAQRVFLTRRLVRVVPLYWLATMAFLFMQVVRGHGDLPSAMRLLASLLFWPSADGAGSMLPIYGIGWTLNYEMFFYAVFAAALAWPPRRGLWLILASLGLLVVLGQVVALPQPVRFWAHPILIDFELGLLLGILHDRGVRFTPGTAWAIAATGALALVSASAAGLNFTPDAPEHATWRWLVWGLPSAALFAALAFPQRVGGRPHRLLGFLGDASYALYLVHPLVIIPMRPVLPFLARWLPGELRSASLIQLLLVLLLTIAVAALVHTCVERPLLRLGRRSQMRFAPTTRVPA